MKAPQILIAQHRAIDALFEEVEHEVRRRARAGAVSRLAEELIAHMAAEEAVFYPAARRIFDDSGAAGERSEQTHLLLRMDLRRLLETNVGDPTFEERLAALRVLHDRHVRDEEGDVFRRLLACASDAQLESLGADILASRPPVWIVTTEGRSLVRSGDDWALRSSVSLPLPSTRQ